MKAMQKRRAERSRPQRWPASTLSAHSAAAEAAMNRSSVSVADCAENKGNGNVRSQWGVRARSGAGQGTRRQPADRSQRQAAASRQLRASRQEPRQCAAGTHQGPPARGQAVKEVAQAAANQGAQHPLKPHLARLAHQRHLRGRGGRGMAARCRHCRRADPAGRMHGHAAHAAGVQLPALGSQLPSEPAPLTVTTGKVRHAHFSSWTTASLPSMPIQEKVKEASRRTAAASRAARR